MAFDKEQLLLSPDKAAQLTKGLQTLGVDDPLQYVCDEAAADVARLTLGYVIDEVSQRTFIRALAVLKAYTYANVPPPLAVKEANDAAWEELQAIAAGKRPNLPRVDEPEGGNPATGSGGSKTYVPGRMEA